MTRNPSSQPDATGVTATVVAPSQTTFAQLSGQAAIDCRVTSTTLLTCTVDQTAGGTPKVWTIPVTVSTTAQDGDTVSGGCVSLNGDTDCADAVDVDSPIFAVEQPLTLTTTVGFDPVVVAPGGTGTGAITLTYEGVTLTVPLTALPGGFTVTGAGTGCTVGTVAITCAGLPLTADETRRVTIDVAVATTATAGASWAPTNVRLVSDRDPENLITTTGTVASTTLASGSPQVTVAIGRPSVPNPAPGQTTVLPITLTNRGTGDADPYRLVLVVPDGTTHGTLPQNCAEGSSPRIVICQVPVAAGRTANVSLPLIVNADQTPGTELTGGIGDQACGGTGDLGLPAMTVSDPEVDLSIRYLNPEPRAVPGGTIRIGLPYTNNGNTSASGVTFAIDPPAGVTVVKAEILLDAAAAGFASAFLAGPDSSQMVEADCVPDPDGDSNAVLCTGPDAPVGGESQLWLTLKVAAGLAAGTRALDVTISTTSPEGVTVNNTATAQLTIAGSTTPDDSPSASPSPRPGAGGGGGLPKTGQNISGLLALSVLLMAAGVAARVAARKQPALRVLANRRDDE